jgi:sucrose-6-phosphate hydrolase SacC (GH32 family)
MLMPWLIGAMLLIREPAVAAAARLAEFKSEALPPPLAKSTPFTEPMSDNFDPRPAFHFTPKFGWMNDPNGLSFVVPAGGGPPVYHLFFQANPCSTCATWAPKSCGEKCNQWGHATSSDLVTWTQQPTDRNHSIHGASGSAIVLSPKLRAATGYVAVAFASAAMWGSKAESLQGWERAVDKSGAALFKLTGAPPGFGTNGDNNAWLDAEEDAIYYLSGSTLNKDVDVDVDAAALYRSTSLDLNASSWEFVTEFYTGSKADYSGIGANCPDVWRNASGDSETTVLMWLQHPPWHKPWDTAWTVGAQNNSSAAPHWTQRGLVDQSSAFIAAQSFTDAKGRRVIFAWVQTPPNKVFVGLQSFPRELWLDPKTQRLHSRPISELAMLRSAGVNSSVRFAQKVAAQTEVVAGVEGQHSFQLLLSIKLAELVPDGASIGVELFRGGENACTPFACGLAITLTQPACANSSELLQSDLIGEDLASLTPPESVAANESEAAEWCHAQCCVRAASCRGWTSSHVLNRTQSARCRLKGSGAAVGTTGGGGCLAMTMGTPGEPDGSGNWRCISGLRGLELRVDSQEWPRVDTTHGLAVDTRCFVVPVHPKPGGEVELNILADKMIVEVFVEDARGEGAAAITAVFGGVCANCTGASLFVEGGAAAEVEAQAFVVGASSALKSDDVIPV